METVTTWKDGMAFDGHARGSGFSLSLDSAIEHGGDNTGFRPLELLLVGLSGCTAMDVISILKKKKQDIHHFEVKAYADRAADHPRVFTHIMLEFIVDGVDIDRVAVERAVELSSTKYCSAQAMLGKAVPIEHRIIINGE